MGMEMEVYIESAICCKRKASCHKQAVFMHIQITVKRYISKVQKFNACHFITKLTT